MRCCCEATKPGVHHLFRRDAQLVSHVDHVNDERAFDAAVFEHDVEVAEGSGVRRGDPREAQRDRDSDQNSAEHWGHSTGSVLPERDRPHRGGMCVRR